MHRQVEGLEKLTTGGACGTGTAHAVTIAADGTEASKGPLVGQDIDAGASQKTCVFTFC